MTCLFFSPLFRRVAVCLFSLLISCSLASEEIPSLIHWIRFDSSSLSKEEILSIKSWKKLHPKWHFKLWSNAPCSLQELELCQIDSWVENPEHLRKTVLQKEGGIAIDLQLVGCKPLDQLAKQGIPFQTADGQSMIGCPPNGYEVPRKILPHSFLLPDQIFTAKIPASPLEGVCFPRFKTLPRLTEETLKIHTASQEAKIQTAALSKKISKIKPLILAIFLLSLFNAFVLILSFPWLTAPSTHKKELAALLVCALLLVSFIFLPLFPKFKSLSSQLRQKIDTRSFHSLSHLNASPKPLFSEDLKNFKIYDQLFANHFLPVKPVETKKIPQVIHLIWGGAPFPESSIANLASWMRHHPDWTFMFWTDDPERPIPLPGVKKRLFEEILSQSQIRPYFEQSQNWGEKSDLLRYEILLQEGGLYIDHDVECLHPFTSLHDRVAFYATLEPFHQSPIYDSHLLIVSNCLIGAAPNHPILSDALSRCVEKWNLASEIFPCEDQQSNLLRTLYRTFSSFEEALHSHISAESDLVILPSSFVFLRHFAPGFSASLKMTDYPLANHQWANTWFRESPSVQPLSIINPLAHKISLLTKFCKRIACFLTGTLLSLTIFLLCKFYVQNNLPFPLRSPLIRCAAALRKFKWRRLLSQ